VPSSRRKSDPRRSIYLSLAGQIESQLREAYGRKFEAGLTTQSSLAKRLGINRSAVHHRLMGHTNMTIETIADMVWALDHDIRVRIYDPLLERSNADFRPEKPLQPEQPKIPTPTGSPKESDPRWHMAQ
jgi:hypothetical protein